MSRASSPPSPGAAPFTQIHKHEQEALVTQVHVANFWPKDIFLQMYTDLPRPKAWSQGEDRYGVKCEGILRKPPDDPPEGELPRRVSKIMKEHRLGVERSQLFDDSKDHR